MDAMTSTDHRDVAAAIPRPQQAWTVRQHVRLDCSDLIAFVRAGWADLVAAGHAAADALPYEDGDSALSIVGEDGTPLAVLVYRHTRVPPRTFIAFGFVAESHRRRGLYSALYEALVDRARAAGSGAIESEAYPDNKIIMALARRQGRSVSRVILQAKL